MHARLILAKLEEHPLRQPLNVEFHARPPVPLSGATLISHLVFKHGALTEVAERENLARWCQGLSCTAIDSSEAHLTVETATFSMRWELHTEFSSYTFFRSLQSGEALSADATALDALHLDWMQSIPGKLIVAAQIEHGWPG